MDKREPFDLEHELRGVRARDRERDAARERPADSDKDWRKATEAEWRAKMRAIGVVDTI